MTSVPERAAAADEWLPALYDALRDLAGRALRRDRGARTLQPTALVHEAWLRLEGTPLVVEGERHFLAIAARAVREVLVDHARRRHAAKRGGGWSRVTLHPGDVWTDGGGGEALDLLALDEALVALERVEPRAARVVELRFFSGLGIDETASALGVSASTVDVDWRFARAWLSRALDGRDR